MRLLLPFLLFMCAAWPALAGAEVKSLGSFGRWSASMLREGGKPVCYMSLRPTRAEWKALPASKPAPQKSGKGEKGRAEKVSARPQPPKRGDMYLMVTLRPSESYDPVVSTRAGYAYKQGTEVLLRMGPKPYALFTEKDQGWARTAAIDIALTKALRAAKSLSVEGVAASGAKSLDTYELAGADKAYKTIAKACGLSE